MSSFFSLDVSPEIIRAASAGDAGAHERIYLACRRPVYTLIRRLIPRAAVADDVFQDTCVELLRNIGAYSGQGSFGGWVRSIALSKCLMYLRSPWHRNFRSLDSEPDSGLAEPSTHADDPLDSQSELAQALAQLPVLTRSVVWLHDVEGFTHAEIGRMLGRTTSFSKSQLARAHLRLRQQLEFTRSIPFVAPSRRPSDDSLTQCIGDDVSTEGDSALITVRE